MKRLADWWFPELPVGRIAALRVVLYLFVWFDVFVYNPRITDRGNVLATYQPLAVERVLHLPAPTHALALTVQSALLVTATLAATGRLPRLLGGITFLLYFWWIVIGDSFGYVPHDRFAFVVALAVLPTVGPARRFDLTTSATAGWALRCIQVAVIATYFLAPWSKFRFGGFDWADGAVFVWALLRRGTPIGTPLLHHPSVLHVAQWGMLVAELGSPIVLFLRGRWLYVGVAVLLSFHVVTEATLSISFLPHVLCLLAFLPLERLNHLFRRAAERTPPHRDGISALPATTWS